VGDKTMSVLTSVPENFTSASRYYKDVERIISSKPWGREQIRKAKITSFISPLTIKKLLEYIIFGTL
jgi:hypothetical protein